MKRRKAHWKTGIRLVLLGAFVLSLLIIGGVSVQAEKVTIRFLTEESDPASVKWFDEKVNEFEQMYPEADISVEVLGHEILERIFLQGIAQGDAPEISTTGAESGKYIREGLLEPVTDVIDALGRGGISEACLYQRGGEDYVVPYAVGMYMLWARTDLVKDAGLLIPRTWNEFLAFSEKLTADFDGDGVIDRYGTVFPIGQSNACDQYLYGRFLSNDVHVLKDSKEVVIDQPPYRERAIETLNFLKNMAGFIPPGATGYGWTDMTHAYYSETVASTWYAARLLNLVIANAPHLENVSDTFVYPFQRRPATMNGWDGWVVARGSDRPDLSKKFIISLLSGSSYYEFLHTVPLHLIPIRSSQVYDPEWTSHPVMERHPDTVTMTQSQVRYSHGLQQSFLGGDYLTDFDEEDIFTDLLQEIILQGADTEEALDRAADRMRQVIQGR